MKCRQIWEDLYGVEILTGTSVTDLSSAIAAGILFNSTGTTSHGIVSNGTNTNLFNVLPVDSFPEFKAPLGIVEKSLATGKSIDNVYSLTTVAAQPEPVIIPVLWNAHKLAFFKKLFFQNGVTVGDGTTNTALQIMTAVPYTDSCPTTFGNAVRVRQDSAQAETVDEILQGVICTRMVIRGEEGGLLEGEVELLGAKWSQGDLTAAQVTAIAPIDTLPPLKYEDCTIKIQSSTNPLLMDTINAPKFEITLTNNAVGHFYNEKSLKTLNLLRFKVEGSIDIPWNDPSDQGSKKQIADFASGADKVLSIVWGNPAFNAVAASPVFGVDTVADKNSVATNNYFGLHVNMRIVDYSNEDLDESPMIPIQFRMVEDAAGTIGTFKAITGYLKTTNKY